MMSSLLDDITLFSFKKRRVCLREKEKIKTKYIFYYITDTLFVRTADLIAKAKALEDSFVDDIGEFSREDVANAAANWHNIESDEDIINLEVEEAIEKFEAEQESEEESDDEMEEEEQEVVDINISQVCEYLDMIKTFCKQEGLDENVLGQCNQLERTIRNSRAKKKAESGKTNPTITTFFQSVPKEK